MTPDEAYATLFGVPDPIQSGKQWAESVWGVDGLSLQEAKRLVQAEAEAMRHRLKDAPCARFEHEGIPLVDRRVDYFTVAAKARLYDLYMARQHHRGARMSRPARTWSARDLRRIEHLRKEGLSWRKVGEAMGSSSASCHRAWRAHTVPPCFATPDRLAAIQAATTEISVMAGILARMADGDKQTGTELAWLADGIGRYAHAIEDCIS